MVSRSRPGILFVISAPSGTGKSSVAARLLERVPSLSFSVSYTTRSPRSGEQNGREYHFVDRETFESMIARGELLESASVFGQYYGTATDDVKRTLDSGNNMLLDIDVQGARQVRSGPVESVSVMILPPDYQTLEQRLRKRGSEAEQELAKRLAESREEAEDFVNFDYVVVNDDLEETVEGLIAILSAERLRSSHCAGRARRIIATFPA